MATYPDEVGTDIVVALDLAYAVSPAEVREYLDQSKAADGANVDLDSLSQLVAGIRGAALGIRIVDAPVGELRIEFARDATILAPLAKALVLEILADTGATVDDFYDWDGEVQGNMMYLRGPLSIRGLRRILSLVDLPTPPLETPEPRSPQPSPGESEPAAPAESQVDSTAAASLRHFRSVSALMDDVLKPPRGTIKTMGQYALWLDRFSRKIDQLPIRNVDKDLLDYSAEVAATLRAVADGYRGVGIYAGALSRNPTIQYVGPAVDNAYFRSYGYRYGNYAQRYHYYTRGPSPSKVAERRGKAQAVASEADIVRQLEDQRAQIRRLMTERYDIEF
jgi:hypothetical protein